MNVAPWSLILAYDLWKIIGQTSSGITRFTLLLREECHRYNALSKPITLTLTSQITLYPPNLKPNSNP